MTKNQAAPCANTQPPVSAQACAGRSEEGMNSVWSLSTLNAPVKHLPQKKGGLHEAVIS